MSVEQGKVTEISVTPLAGEEVVFERHSCFSGDPFTGLQVMERVSGDEVYEDVGFLMFPKIGLMATGHHDHDRSQLAVTLVPAPLEEDFSDAEEVTFFDE